MKKPFLLCALPLHPLAFLSPPHKAAWESPPDAGVLGEPHGAWDHSRSPFLKAGDSTSS